MLSITNWYIQAGIAAIAFTVALFCLQSLQKSYPIDVYLFYVWLGNALFFGLALGSTIKHLNAHLLLILIIAGFINWLANYAYNIAMSKQPNLGYVEAVSSVRVLILYVASIIFLNDILELSKLAGSILMVIAISLVRDSKQTHTRSDRGWFIWGLASGGLLSLWIIAIRYTNEHGISSEEALSIWLIPATLMYAGSAIVKHHNLKLRYNKSLLLLMIAIAAYIVANLALFAAYSAAPNLAYPTAINSSRIVLMYLMSIFLVKAKVKPKDLVGVACAFFSLIMLA